jgi:hypothetical protein
MTASVANVSNEPVATYTWSIIPGTSTGSVTSGQGTTTIDFTAGNTLGTFQLQLVVQNQAGTVATSAQTITIQTGTWVPTGTPPPGANSPTVLPNGTVLVVGSNPSIYNPATGVWVAATNPPSGTGGATTLLANGTVLVPGTPWYIYNPTSTTWTPTNSPAFGGITTLLANGKVLLVGVEANSLSAVVYDPLSGNWAATGPLPSAYLSATATGIYGPTLTALLNGQALLEGGGVPAGSNPPFGADNAALYDPATNTWSATANVTVGGFGRTAIRLTSGQVLVVGGVGYGIPNFYTPSAAIYDPATAMWTTTGSMGIGRAFQAATLLQNGKVLVAGGTGSSDHAIASAELYDPGTGVWTSTGSLLIPQSGSSTALLQNGNVLDISADGSDAEIYAP